MISFREEDASLDSNESKESSDEPESELIGSHSYTNRQASRRVIDTKNVSQMHI